MKHSITYLLGVALFWGCNSANQKNAQQTPSDTLVAAVAAPANDSLSVYFANLKLDNPQTIQVANDPVFHGPKSYQGVLMKAILEKHTKIKTLNPKQSQIVFECEDGYNPSMSLELFLSKTAYLAVKDNDAPKGQDWVNHVKRSYFHFAAIFHGVYPVLAFGRVVVFYGQISGFAQKQFQRH